MESIKTKIDDVEIGKYDVDSILIKNGDTSIQICFDKKSNISQFIGKDVIIKNKNGVFTVSENIPDTIKK
jgi:hypothetical protein